MGGGNGFIAFGFVIIDMEFQYVAVVNGIGDGVGVQLLFKDIQGCLKCGVCAVNAFVTGVFFENRRAGKAKQLSFREEVFNRPMVFAELAAVAFVKDKDHALVFECA